MVWPASGERWGVGWIPPTPVRPQPTAKPVGWFGVISKPAPTTAADAFSYSFLSLGSDLDGSGWSESFSTAAASLVVSLEASASSSSHLEAESTLHYFVDAEAESYGEPDGDVLAEMYVYTNQNVGATVTATTTPIATQILNLDSWVRFVDIAVVGGGAGGTGAGINNGNGGGGGRWNKTIAPLERLCALAGLDFDDHRIYIEYQVPAAAAVNAAGGSVTARIMAANRTTSAIKQLYPAAGTWLTGSGGQVGIMGGGVGGPGVGGPTTQGSAAGSGGRDEEINGKIYYGVDSNPNAVPGLFPGGGGRGGVVFTGPGAQVGGRGRAHFRLYSSSPVSQFAFTTSTSGVWKEQELPTETAEVAVAVVGGGGGGGGSSLGQRGQGGGGGAWARPIPVKWVVSNLLDDKGIDPGSLTRLLIEYQVGAGGAGGGGVLAGISTGRDGTASSARLVAVAGANRTILATTTGASGVGAVFSLTTSEAEAHGRAVYNGNTTIIPSQSVDYAVLVLGKQIVFKGGAKMTTSGRNGNSPGGGGSGGSLGNITGWPGGKGADGAVYVAFG